MDQRENCPQTWWTNWRTHVHPKTWGIQPTNFRTATFFDIIELLRKRVEEKTLRTVRKNPYLLSVSVSVHMYESVYTLVSWRAVRIYQPPNPCMILWMPTPSSPQLLGLNPSKAWLLGEVFKWSQGALLGGLGCVLCGACVILWSQHGFLTSKAKLVRQLVDNAYLSWTWSVLQLVFMLKARQFWV